MGVEDCAWGLGGRGRGRLGGGLGVGFCFVKRGLGWEGGGGLEDGCCGHVFDD